MNNVKNLLLVYFATALLICPCPAHSAYDDYTAFPPFLTSAVPPNVLLVLDRSGSMGWEAYAGTFSDTTTYEGYFVPTIVYEYASTVGSWQESSSAADTCATRFPDTDDKYTGSCLNFHYMQRLDLLRWSLTGGKPDGCSTTLNALNCDPNLSTSTTCSGTTCRLKTNAGVKVDVPKSRVKGILQEFEDKVNRPRFGVIFYESGVESDSVYMGDYFNGGTADAANPYTFAIRFINAMPEGGGTGSGPGMEEAYDYFKQSNDHTTNTAPFTLADDPPKEEFRDPINICDADQEDCNSAPCMKNFVIFVSDGEWTRGADPVIPAYEMHTDVLRTLDAIDIRVESVFSLGLFMSGDGERALKHVAMYGSFDTTGRSWPGGTTDYPDTSLTTNIPSPSHLDWDADIDGDPDTFFSAQNAGEIKDNLKKYIYNVLKQSAAGSAVSVLSERTVSGATVHQALFFPAKYYNTSYKVDWTGVLNSYWFYNTSQVSNIREDNTSGGEFALDKLTDHPLDFTINKRGALAIDYYGTESNGGTDFTTGILGSYSSVDDVHKIWEGGDQLRQRAGSSRKIYGVNDSNVMTEFTTATTTFDGLFGDTANMDPCLGDTATDRPANLIKYTRGEQDDFSASVGGCRSRVVNSSGDIWKLGDTVSSTGRVVDYDFVKTSGTLPAAIPGPPPVDVKHGVLYMGSNDGLLHAFHVGKIRKDGLGTDQVAKLCDNQTGTCTTAAIGEELWAFIPKNTMPYLRYLADPDYQHMYTVDMAPYLIEDNGKKILIGGMRMGGATGCVSGGDWCGDTDGDGLTDVDSDGDAKKQIIPPQEGSCSAATPENCLGLSSYFAIDITDPYDPIFLWEFSHEDLGFSYSGPAFIKRDTGSGVNRYIMFLSGPLNYKGFADGQEAKIFILKVDGDFQMVDSDNNTTINNNDAYIMTTGKTDAYGGRLFTDGIDANSDGNTDLIAFGVNWRAGGNWMGNVFAVGPNDSDPCSTTSCTSPNWELTKAFNSAHAPVTGKVLFSPCFGEPFIYYGTGRWLYKNDTPGTGANPNALYGVKLGTCLDNLLDNDTNTTCADGLNLNSAHSSSDICGHLSDDKASWKIGRASPPTYRGLANADTEYMEERSISDPTGSDFDLVFFTTTQPSLKLCAFGGRSRIWGLNCMNGSSLASPDDACEGYVATVPNTALLLQLSGGNIEDARLDTSFNADGTTEWYQGTPSEDGGILPPPGGGLTGDVILWIER